MSRHYGTTSGRGYGSQHQKLRAQWKPLVDSGQVQCHAIVCLEERDGGSRWITPGSPWHLGHTPDRSGWTGPEHARCGAADGATRGNQDRPRFIASALPGRDTICKTCGKPYHYPAKQCGICGSHYHPSRQVQYTCSRQCGVIFRRTNRPLPTPKPNPPKPKPSPHKCEFCGITFMTVKGARFCSNKCGVLKRYYATRTTGRPTQTEAGAVAWQAAKRKRETGTVTAHQSRAW